MQKSSGPKYCSLLKPRIPKNRQANEWNVTGSSITINCHSRWGQKTYPKAQKCSKNFTDVICCTTACSNYWRKSESVKFFPTSFAVILPAVALPVGIKAEFNFELILYITIFVFLSPGSFFKSVICFKSWTVLKIHLKAHQSFCFRRSWREEKLFTRKVWRLCSPWSFVFPFHFKC